MNDMRKLLEAVKPLFENPEWDGMGWDDLIDEYMYVNQQRHEYWDEEDVALAMEMEKYLAKRFPDEWRQFSEEND